ncbi:MAG: Lrp/AsnC family transcriptional regulator [Thermodesulfobacteriota bacterium]|nr:Lrp/AsnC family transcriptional regulator [Thermodesulfobacteriota bacterium]
MKKISFDATDRQIVDLLGENGRITAKAIAGRLGLAEATVRNRLNHLIHSDQIRVQGLVNQDLLDDQVVALVGLEVKEVKDLNEIGEKIAGLPSVQNVLITSGRYDFLVEILVSSNRGIIGFLSDELSGIKGVGKSETFLILKSFGKWITINQA